MSTTTQLELFSTRAETLGLLATVMNDFRRKGEYLVPDYTFKAALALVLNDNTRRLCEEILEIEDLPEESELIPYYMGAICALEIIDEQDYVQYPGDYLGLLELKIKGIA